MDLVIVIPTEAGLHAYLCVQSTPEVVISTSAIGAELVTRPVSGPATSNWSNRYLFGVY